MIAEIYPNAVILPAVSKDFFRVGAYFRVDRQAARARRAAAKLPRRQVCHQLLA
jgi:hypothetical protein